MAPRPRRREANLSLLTANNVRIVLGEKVAVDGVSLTVRPGEVLAICGPNGAGKSTLLSALAGRIPTSGISLRGEPLSRWDRRELARTRAVLTQHTPLTFPLTAQEVVALGRHPHRTSTADPEIIAAAMHSAGVDHLATRAFTTLSGGERQRVHLARVLAQLHGPQAALLLLDEPTSALDPAQAEQILTLARDLAHRDGLAVVMVLHDLDQAAAFADRVLWMSAGRMVAIGPIQEVFTSALLHRTYGIRTHITSHPDNGRPLVVIARTGVKHGTT